MRIKNTIRNGIHIGDNTHSHGHEMAPIIFIKMKINAMGAPIPNTALYSIVVSFMHLFSDDSKSSVFNRDVQTALARTRFASRNLISKHLALALCICALDQLARTVPVIVLYRSLYFAHKICIIVFNYSHLELQPLRFLRFVSCEWLAS